MQVQNITDLRTINGTNITDDIAKVLGYSIAGDGGGGDFYWDSTSTEADNSGTIFQVTGVTTGRWKRLYSGVINVKWFGAKGDGSMDDTDALIKAINYAKLTANSVVYFPKSIYNYTDLGNIAFAGVTFKGEDTNGTILNCTTDVYAFNLPNFTTDTNNEYANYCNIENVTIVATDNAPGVLYMSGISRSYFHNINLIGANVNGVALSVMACHINNFQNVRNSYVFGNASQTGLLLSTAQRNGVTQGNSTNNTFTECAFEGNNIGINLYSGDQNYFMGGTAESCTTYGCTVNALSKFNTFVAFGFENPDATADITDGGQYTKHINCYYKNMLRIGNSSISVSVEGGASGSIDIQSSASRPTVSNIGWNHWPGTFSNACISATINNVYNEQTTSYQKNSTAESLKYRSVTASGNIAGDGVNELIEVNSGGTTIALVIQGSDSGGLGTVKWIRLNDAGVVQITAGTGVTLAPINSINIRKAGATIKLVAVAINSWRIIEVLYNNPAGTTLNRPTLSTADIGYTYFDSNLNKPIWWNGSNWFDSTGTAV